MGVYTVYWNITTTKTGNQQKVDSTSTESRRVYMVPLKVIANLIANKNVSCQSEKMMILMTFRETGLSTL